MNGITVAVHKRHFGRDKVIYDPWHYLAVLERKPGALRNGAPFRQWDLPESICEVRTLLEVRPDGDRQFVGILTVVGRYSGAFCGVSIDVITLGFLTVIKIKNSVQET